MQLPIWPLNRISFVGPARARVRRLSDRSSAAPPAAGPPPDRRILALLIDHPSSPYGPPSGLSLWTAVRVTRTRDALLLFSVARVWLLASQGGPALDIRCSIRSVGQSIKTVASEGGPLAGRSLRQQPNEEEKIMKIWTKPAVREQEVGLEVTSYLPAEIDII